MGLGPGRGGQALGCLLPRLLSLQAQGHSGDTEAPLRGQVSRFGPPSSPASAHGRARAEVALRLCPEEQIG